MSGSKPIFAVYVGGTDITEEIQDRLLSLRVMDEGEIKNDRLEISIDNTPPWVTLPTVGDTFTVYLGYEDTGLRQMNSYEFDESVAWGPPHTLNITAHGKDTGSDMKGSRHRSWHNDTLGNIVSKIAGEMGMGVQMDPSLMSIKIDHADQTTHSNMGFLTDLARKNNAVMKLVNGQVYFAPFGQTNASGGAVSGVDLDFDEETMHYTYISHTRGNYDGVKARYLDRNKMNKNGGEYYGSGGNAEGNNVYTMPDLYTSEAEATRAAGALFGAMQRSLGVLELTIPGNPDIMSETSLSLVNFPPFIPTAWLVDKCQHALDDKGAYVTKMTCVIPGSSDSGGGGGGGGQEEKQDDQNGGGDDGYKDDSGDD